MISKAAGIVNYYKNKNLLGDYIMINKHAEENHSIAPTLLAGGAGVGAGSALMAALRNKQMNDYARKAKLGVGIAVALPALIAAAKKAKVNASDLFAKTADESDITAYVAPSVAGLAGAGVGAAATSKLMEKYVKRMQRYAQIDSVIDLITGRGGQYTPRALSNTVNGIELFNVLSPYIRKAIR